MDFLFEPLTANTSHELGGIGLVEHDRAGRPAIRKRQAIQVIQNSWSRCARKSDNRKNSHVGRAQHRLEPAGQRLVGQQRIDVHGNFGHANTVTLGRDRRVQIGQRDLIIEPGAFGHEPFNELKHAAGLIDKPTQQFASACSYGAIAALIEQSLCLGGSLLRRQIEEGQEIAGLIVGACLLELCSALGVDQCRCDIRKGVRRVGTCKMPLRLNE
jgi:hypothetical protein